jgi:hypothetical protein
MSADRVRGSLLRPTIGRLMGLTAAVALMLALWRAAVAAIIPAALSTDAALWLGSALGCLFLLAPTQLLAIVLIFLSRRLGPIGRWYVLFAVSSLGALAGLPFLVQDVACKVLTGRPTTGFPAAVGLGAVFVAVYGLLLRSEWPRRCPRCGCRSAVRLFRDALVPRPAGTRPPIWCASCGAEFATDATPVRWRVREAAPPVSEVPG